jgi:threonylcarbamoyladenosine tRNA methylthiotransferase MtaB
MIRVPAPAHRVALIESRIMPAFRCEFLGCKVNQYDAERARAALLARGFADVSDGEEPADLLLLAACTVTARAASKGQRALRTRLKQQPQLRVAVLGCLTDEDRRFYHALGGAVTLLPSATDERFVATLAPIADELAARAAPAKPAPVDRDDPRIGHDRRRTRAFLKVEDGCDLACSFCIIPKVRGPARSRAVEEIVAEARTRIGEGVRELVLTGVHLGQFGRGFAAAPRGGSSLATLVRRLAALPGDFRLRLSSLEASELTAELAGLFVHEPRLVPHLHLPLQSGSERILRRMRRPYTTELYRRRILELRERLDDPGLTTDVMVGFPGESDADFAATAELCRAAGFAKLHLFSYSRRAGTEAAAFDDEVEPSVVAARRAELVLLDATLRAAALRRRVGTEAQIVIEELLDDGARAGYDERYHRTRLASCRLRRGDVARVRIVGCDRESLLAVEADAAETVDAA